MPLLQKHTLYWAVKPQFIGVMFWGLDNSCLGLSVAFGTGLSSHAPLSSPLTFSRWRTPWCRRWAMFLRRTAGHPARSDRGATAGRLRRAEWARARASARRRAAGCDDCSSRRQAGARRRSPPDVAARSSARGSIRRTRGSLGLLHRSPRPGEGQTPSRGRCDRRWWCCDPSPRHGAAPCPSSVEWFLSVAACLRACCTAVVVALCIPSPAVDPTSLTTRTAGWPPSTSAEDTSSLSRLQAPVTRTYTNLSTAAT